MTEQRWARRPGRPGPRGCAAGVGWGARPSRGGDRTLDEVELAGEADEAVGAASVTLHRQANRLQARVVELLGEVDARQAHEHDGAVSAKQWFRSRARCEPGEAGALVTASRRLRRLPQQQPLK